MGQCAKYVGERSFHSEVTEPVDIFSLALLETYWYLFVDTNVSSTLRVLTDNALYKTTHSLTLSLPEPWLSSQNIPLLRVLMFAAHWRLW